MSTKKDDRLTRGTGFGGRSRKDYGEYIMAKYIPSMVFLAFGNEVLSLAALSVVMICFGYDLMKGALNR